MPSGGHNKVYSPEVAQRIIELFSQGKMVSEVSEIIGVGIDAIQRWRLADAKFDRECSRAQDLGFEIQADTLTTIPDTYIDVQRARLKSENLRWLLARRAAHRYGDRIEVNVNQSVDISAALAEAKQRSIRDQSEIEDAQVIEATALLPAPSTGCESVADRQDGEKSQDPFQ